MMESPMKKLSEIDQNLIISSKSIQYFHCIIEELIYNSIEAKAKNISIKIDFLNFFVEIQDDGIGISPEDLKVKIGLWNHSSKWTSPQSFHKGMALATILNIVSEYSISTKCSQDNKVYCKFQRVNKEQSFSVLSNKSDLTFQNGTLIQLSGIFYNLGLRRKSMKIQSEKFNIREFVTKMSVMNHQINWNVIDINDHSVLLRLSGQISVSKRLMQLHGVDILTKMEFLRLKRRYFEIEGFLSAPLQSCLAETSDCQYMFINNRWIKNKDPITKLINEVYAKLVLENNQPGPEAKHNSALKRYPSFILKFTVDSAELDLNVEVDKSEIIFKDLESVKLFLYSFLKEFNEPKYLSFVQKLQQLKANRRVWAVPFENKINESFTSKPIPTFHLPQNSQANLNNLFVDAFSFPFSTEERNGGKNETFNYSTVDKSVKVSRLPIIQDVFSFEDNLSSRSKYQSQAESLRLTESNNDNELSIFETKYSFNWNSKRQKSIPEIQNFENNSFGGIIIQGNIDKNKSYENNISQKFQLFSDKTIHLSLDTLRRIKVFGLLDSKFILSIDPMTKTFIVMDQHAVDERIQFHQLSSVPFSTLITPVKINEQIQLNLSQCMAVKERTRLLKIWFIGIELPVVNFQDEFQNDLLVLVDVISVPSIFGEVFTLEDIVEFLALIAKEFCLPDSILIPPAYSRILATKACRSAIKFGDSISISQAEILVDNLSKTNYPFQCAHGRPSTAPIFDFSFLKKNHNSKRKRIDIHD